jgi:uncharacterized membrane protein
MSGRIMRRTIGVAILILAAALLTAGPAAADLGGYTITDFHTDLQVEPNSELIVTERIEVDFNESRHGIYRTIPVRYSDPRGYMYSLGFNLLDVTDGSGDDYQTKVTREGPYVKIRIGDPDSTVYGPVVYVIRYRVRDALRHLSEHDELYWNAVGDEWQTTIGSASATVHLPESIGEESLSVSGYSGPFGSRTQDVDIDSSAPGVVSYRARTSLEPREGLTVVAGWPHGYVEFPGTGDKILRFVLDNIFLLAPFVVLGMMFRQYRRAGRDPEGDASVVVRYEPPEGVGPGEIGTIVDEEVDMRDITAVVVNLAVRGYLSIGVEEKDRLFWKSESTYFERNTEKDSLTLQPHERLILDGLFESGNRVALDDLRQEFYVHLPRIRDEVYSRLVDQGYFGADPSTVRTKYGLLGGGVGIAVAALGVLWALLRGGVPPYIMIVPSIAGVLSAIVVFVFTPAMPRRTAAGVQLRGWALGFEEFVHRVEADRLERAEARNAFEALLPYAMALGVAAAWARKFEGIYEEGGPGWYVGPYYAGGFSTTDFESSLSAVMSDAGKGMAQAPRSSGSSGVSGGFSGGGFGGGGGGSW